MTDVPEPMTAPIGRVVEFEDVVISPFEHLLDQRLGGLAYRGGPRWPDWDAQHDARHCRNLEPIDEEPATIEPAGVIEETLTWGGPIVDHFGHQVADFSTRLLPALAEDPGANFAFASSERVGIHSMAEAPGWVLDIYDWLGVAPARRIFVDKPVLTRRLRVAAQGEQLFQVVPSAGYLDLLDELFERRSAGRERQRADVLYVSRAAMRARYAGESYVETALRTAGAKVLRPETIPVAEQLFAYAGAERLLFSEGSAVHGTQLLGRSLGDVLVIGRRRTTRIAEAALRPRARSVTYRSAATGLVHGYQATGKPAYRGGISVQDEEELLDIFTDQVPGLRQAWRSAEFGRTRDEDVLDWCKMTLNRKRLSNPQTWSSIRETIESTGLGHLSPRVEKMMQRRGIAVEERSRRSD